jgi:hypothetical protein
MANNNAKSSTETLMPVKSQSVADAIGGIVNLTLTGVKVIKQGSTLPDGSLAKATVVTIDRDLLKAAYPKLNAEGIRAKMDEQAAELKKADGALSGATAADKTWVTRRLRVAISDKGARKGLQSMTVTRQEIRVASQAASLASVHGGTVEYWEKVIAKASDKVPVEPEVVETK